MRTRVSSTFLVRGRGWLMTEVDSWDWPFNYRGPVVVVVSNHRYTLAQAGSANVEGRPTVILTADVATLEALSGLTEQSEASIELWEVAA